MKTKIFLIIGIVFSAVSFAQTTSVPDTNFEHYLETHSKVDGSVVAVGDANSMGNGIDGDHLVTTANINTRTHLSVSDLSISDMTGLEDFISLTDLSCARNNLTSITLPDVNGLAAFMVDGNQLTTINFPASFTSLGEFTCQNNQLTSINFNNITYINFFVGDDNLFTDLDFSSTDVEGMNCSNNPNLTSIDFRNGADYTEVYQFTATNNPLLTCIYVDNVTYATTNWTDIDVNTQFVDTEATCTFNSTHTYVPDTNFEQALIDEGYDDVLDDYVLTSNINLRGYLDISNKAIADLTGIEGFSSIDTFICDNNNLTSINLTQNINIGEFSCKNNQLTSLVLHPDARMLIDCSSNQLTSLTVPNETLHLNCADNSITELDLSSTTDLVGVNCSDNQLTSLDLRNGQNTQITENYNFDTRNNAGLTCIFIDDIAYSTTNWTNIDGSSHFVTTQAECDAASIITTYVPDNNFEQTLIDLGYDDVLDDYVLTSNINAVQVLDVSNKSISNLTGIEDFTALLSLRCNQNTLTSLDVTHNTLLRELVFSNNQITTIDVSQNTNLENLECKENQLTALDVTHNTGLKYLECWMNQIGNINVAQNTLLEELSISSNPISTLDVTHNTGLKILSFGGNSTTASTIAAIDISNNTQLTNLDFIHTQIASINVSHLSNLSVLFVHNNKLTHLDVSQNTNLVDLVCNDNQLQTLNVKNGNNINFTRFLAQNNSFLSCIQVDDAAWSTTNWTDINGAETFSGNCHYFQTYVPDNNFEQALIDLGYDSGALDDYVPTDAIKVVTTLDVNNKNIADLTGIDDFEALTNLDCSGNVLTELSTAGNMDLQILRCGNNQLTRLEFFNNTNLIQIYCNDNQLTLLDYLYYQTNLNMLDCSNNSLTDVNIGNNPGLLNLFVHGNQLTSLDVSNNTALTVIYVASNQLTALDVSNNTAMFKLNCVGNQLTTLDVSNNTALTNFSCWSNQLTSLDVRNGNNTNFTNFKTTNNPNLTCIYVDDVTWSATNWTDIDATSTFVADEAACTALATEEYTLNEFKILSNPVFETIKISMKEAAEYRFIDMNGKTLKKGKLTVGFNTINVRSISKGIYFLKVRNSVKSSVKKLIIQ